ncbi:MAG: hypothetical protein IJW33_01930 [Lentisphaeria bacterium]|nr:hypothetical protein [Lentisphaeria bacterium]
MENRENEMNPPVSGQPEPVRTKRKYVKKPKPLKLYTVAQPKEPAFVTQQESMVPEFRRAREKFKPEKYPHDPGRPGGTLSPGHFFLLRRLRALKNSGVKLTRIEFAHGMGVKFKLNPLNGAFVSLAQEVKERKAAYLRNIHEKQDFQDLLTTVPVLSQEEIVYRDEEWMDTPERQTVFIPKDRVFGEDIHYFSFVMPDNCMLHDGICKDDVIIAGSNLRPTHGDLAVCRIPGSKHITVRRFVSTSRPQIFELYEGGSRNPMLGYDIEKLIYGVVLNIQRSYHPGRLPFERPDPADPQIPGGFAGDVEF